MNKFMGGSIADAKLEALARRLWAKDQPFKEFVRDLRQRLADGEHAHAILAFGDATFPSGFPMNKLRKILRRLAENHCDVLTFLDIDEFRSSMMCRGCAKPLTKVYRVQPRSTQEAQSKKAVKKEKRERFMKGKAARALAVEQQLTGEAAELGHGAACSVESLNVKPSALLPLPKLLENDNYDKHGRLKRKPREARAAQPQHTRARAQNQSLVLPEAMDTMVSYF
jgi:hypothetical protein